jgi:proteic killer suppression protein
MTVSFKDADTEALAKGRRVRRFASIETVARRKLRQLQIAARLDDLRIRQATNSRRSRKTAQGSTAFG